MKQYLSKYNEIIDQQQKLENRECHPAGHFDNRNRFYLHTQYECCQSIREPSAAYPFSEMKHARSLIHVVHENDMSEHLCAIKALKNALKNKRIRFKTVAELVHASKAKRKSPKKLLAQKILNFWSNLEISNNKVN